MATETIHPCEAYDADESLLDGLEELMEKHPDEDAAFAVLGRYVAHLAAGRGIYGVQALLRDLIRADLVGSWVFEKALRDVERPLKRRGSTSREPQLLFALFKLRGLSMEKFCREVIDASIELGGMPDDPDDKQYEALLKQIKRASRKYNTEAKYAADVDCLMQGLPAGEPVYLCKSKD